MNNFGGGVGATPGLLWDIRNIQREPKLFGRWQQLCGLSLSALQQLTALLPKTFSALGLVMMSRIFGSGSGCPDIRPFQTFGSGVHAWAPVAINVVIC